MATNAQKRASAKYDRNNTKAIMLKLNKVNDADIIAKLEGVGNKQGYIKDLVRDSIDGGSGVIALESLKLMILPVVKKYGIKKVYLFGSYSRNEANSESDVDLMIEGGNIQNAFDFVEVKEAFECAIGRSVDLVEYGAAKSNRTRRGRSFFDRADKEKVLIYG